jgi:hypothetical protein
MLKKYLTIILFYVALLGLIVPLSDNVSSIQIEPEKPTNNSTITITFNGHYPNPCYSMNSNFSRYGNNFYFNYSVYSTALPNESCAAVVVPWAITKNVDKLPVGQYSIYRCQNGESPCSMLNFSVIESRDYFVDDDAESSWYNETNYNNIQDAIYNANDGDSLYVYDGTYEPFNYHYLTTGKKIDIAGENYINIYKTQNNNTIFLNGTLLIHYWTKSYDSYCAGGSDWYTLKTEEGEEIVLIYSKEFDKYINQSVSINGLYKTKTIIPAYGLQAPIGGIFSCTVFDVANIKLISSNNSKDSNTPGFELIFFIFSIGFLLLYTRRKKHKK